MSNKKNIAIVWGGYSSEIVVSAHSKDTVYSVMDKTKYSVYNVKVVKEGWSAEVSGQTVSVDKNDFSIIDPVTSTPIKFDFAFILIHGTPGEDGKIQGYFDMMDIPYSSCGVLASSVTMDKFLCNRYLQNFGFRVANAILVDHKTGFNSDEIVARLGLPLFVKPNTGGSSFATTKVKSADQLQAAIDLALTETPAAVIEQFIEGREVTCGCYRTQNEMVVLPITEVVTKNEFFDYEAKYEGAVTEITPARLDAEIENEIKESSRKIYDLVRAKGIVRIDYIFSEKGLFLLEVNTTPGMTATSFIPQQIAAANLNITNVLTEIIENEFNQN